MITVANLVMSTQTARLSVSVDLAVDLGLFYNSVLVAVGADFGALPHYAIVAQQARASLVLFLNLSCKSIGPSIGLQHRPGMPAVATLLFARVKLLSQEATTPLGFCGAAFFLIASGPPVL